MNKQKHNSGFSLLEVMLAVAILSLGLVGLLRAYVTVDQARFNTSRYTKALLLSEQKLAELSQSKISTNKVFEGQFEEPFSDYSWRLVRGKKIGNKHYRVHLTVSWNQWEKLERLITTSTIYEKNYAKK